MGLFSRMNFYCFKTLIDKGIKKNKIMRKNTQKTLRVTYSFLFTHLLNDHMLHQLSKPIWHTYIHTYVALLAFFSSFSPSYTVLQIHY